MDNDLDTLATALYASTDDFLKAHPNVVPWRPAVGLQPLITDAELVTVSVLQALLGYTSERRWLRHARVDLLEWFPHLPGQSGCTLRLRHLGGALQTVIAHLGRDTGLWADGIWVADSTPVECGRSRETAHRSELAGFAKYGYCACTCCARSPGFRWVSRRPARRPMNAKPCSGSSTPCPPGSGRGS